MKEAFVVFSRLGTSKSASVSLYNLIRNIVDKIGQNIITEASFDIQINKLLVRADDKKKNTEIVVPKVETKLENGHTTITVSPLTPSNTFELQQCLEQVKQYVDFIHSNYPSATIHYMDVINNSLDITFDEEIDFTNFKFRKSNQISHNEPTSTNEGDIDLFNILDEVASEEQKQEVPNEENTKEIEEQQETEVINEESSVQTEESVDLSIVEEQPQVTEEPNEQEQPEEIREEITAEGESVEENLVINESPNEKEENLSQKETSAYLEETSNKLMIIDGNNILQRSYYATAFGREEEDLAKDDEGKFINANLVFLQSLERYLRDYSPTHLAVCWDNNNPFLENFRKKLYEDYKGTRDEKPISLMEQLDTMPELLKQMNIAQFMDEKGLYEADDLIGTLVQKWRENNSGDIYIVSNDKDLHQLLDENIYQVIKKGDKEIIFSLEDFQNEYKITPSQWVDIKAVIGDKSDNIPGVSGVGEKYVYDMINEFGSIENLYNNLDKLKENSSYKRYVTKFESQKKEADLSKYLATIVTQAKVDSLQSLNTKDLEINMDEQGKEQVYEKIGLSVRQKSA
jgi:5'-3' exonuclease